jgi:hypothetical protein
MIYIRVEMWPKGQRGTSRCLGEATICNVGGDEQFADYDVKISKFGGFTSRKGEFNDPEGARAGRPLASSVWKKGRVKNFTRRLGPWPLLYRAIAACVRG